MPRGRRRPEPVQHLVEGVQGGGKRELADDTALAATTDEVEDLRREASALKECIADLMLEDIIDTLDLALAASGRCGSWSRSQAPRSRK